MISYLILLLLILAIVFSYLALISGYKMYVNYRKGEKITKKLYNTFFVFFTLALIFFFIWGFSQNLDLPPWANVRR